MGRMISAPVPVAQSIGTRPMIATPSVSSLGRRRCTAPGDDRRSECYERADEDNPPFRVSASRR